jgi:hypothetical protein
MDIDKSFKALFMLDQWDRFKLTECEEIARDLDKVLPASFRFHTIETCSSGNQKRHIAVFEWAGLPEGYYQGFFALIPGGPVTLGYDREHPFVPNRQQRESWINETQRTGMFTGTLDEFLDMTMTPLRHVSLEPFLLEMQATSLQPPPTYDETLGPEGDGDGLQQVSLVRKFSNVSQGKGFVSLPLTNGNMRARQAHELFFAGEI